MSFIDDHTQVSWVFLLKDKTNVYQTFVDFYKTIQTQFRTNIHILHNDNGTKYFNKNLFNFLKHHSIIHKSICPYSPQQNGIAERKNYHILETTRALMLGGNVPKYHQDDVLLVATYLINRLPSRTLSYITPLKVLHDTYNLYYLKNNLPLHVFGCTFYVHLHHSSKLDP